MTDKDKPFKNIIIIGCGDIGQRVAKIWKNKGKSVFGIVRSENSLNALRQQHIHAIYANLDDAKLELNLDQRLLENAIIYYFAPPPASGVIDNRITHFLNQLNASESGPPAQLIYISTSGVYGDQQGQLIDEQTPVNPQVDRAKRRFNAELQLAIWSKESSVPVTILRVGGIYGPGRLPLKRLRDQVPMLHEHLSPQTNRIHADDLAQICVAATNEKAAGEIYNVSDGTNSNMTEYFNTIADFTGLPRPPLVDWDEAEKTISEGMLSYLRESRRMDNSKMMNELGIELRYPTLKDGLESCI